MKRLRLLLLVLGILFFASSLYSQEVIYEGEENGVLMLTVYENNIKKNEAVSQAVADAYFQILYRGIPGSTLCKQPFFGTDETEINAKRAYYDNLLSSGRLYSFVNYSVLSQYKKKVATVRLSINIDALRADLEKKNLYRRLGLY